MMTMIAITPVCRFTIFSKNRDMEDKKGLWNKISLYAFTHPDGCHLIAKATLFVTSMHDGCATFQSPMPASEVTWMWSALCCSINLPNSEIFIAQNNAFFIATVHIVKDAADATDWGTTEQRTRSVSSGLSKQLGHMSRIRSKQSIHQMGRFAH